MWDAGVVTGSGRVIARMALISDNFHKVMASALISWWKPAHDTILDWWSNFNLKDQKPSGGARVRFDDSKGGVFFTPVNEDDQSDLASTSSPNPVSLARRRRRTGDKAASEAVGSVDFFVMNCFYEMLSRPNATPAWRQPNIRTNQRVIEYGNGI